MLNYRRTASSNNTACHRNAVSYRGMLVYRSTASSLWAGIYRETASSHWAVVYREAGGCRGIARYRGMINYRGIPAYRETGGWRHGICRGQWLATHDRLGVMYIARWLTSLKVIKERTSVYSSDWIYACALASYSTPPITLNLLHAGVEATSRGRFENNECTPIRYKHMTISIMNGEFRYIE